MAELTDYKPFNPLDKTNLGISVGDALLESEIHDLPPNERFEGAGLYCIYYRGDFPAYAKLSEANEESWKAPIYIGKAVPKGARKGNVGLGAPPGTVLHRRLTEHSQSIASASNLKLEDFCCRFLVVEDIWIALGEALLLNRFRPLWNRVVDGFGNHAPGRGRAAGARPIWDTLHPGRPWAERCQPRPETVEELIERISLTEITIEGEPGI